MVSLPLLLVDFGANSITTSNRITTIITALAAAIISHFLALLAGLTLLLSGIAGPGIDPPVRGCDGMPVVGCGGNDG
jgi:hypothetical protein